MSFLNILKSYYTPAALAGSRGDKARFRRELEACVSLNARLYFFLIALVLVLFVMAILAIAKDWVTGSVQYTTLLTGLGITATGSLEVMRRIGREWSQSRLLLALMGSVSEGDLQKFVAQLLDQKLAA